MFLRYINTVNMENDVSTVYTKLILERCKRETELRSAMLYTYQNPDTFAYAITSGPGYSVFIRGEAAQLFRCTLVPVQRRQAGSCFLLLPTTYRSLRIRILITTDKNKLR